MIFLITLISNYIYNYVFIGKFFEFLEPCIHSFECLSMGYIIYYNGSNSISVVYWCKCIKFFLTCRIPNSNLYLFFIRKCYCLFEIWCIFCTFLMIVKRILAKSWRYRCFAYSSFKLLKWCYLRLTKLFYNN